MEQHHQHLATKTDLAKLKAELVKSIYLVGLVQFLAIVGSVLAIFSIMR